MKKAFTLIEILIVLIVLGILATITSQIIVKFYENYYYTKEFNKLSFETDLALNKIASKLHFRVPNSLIADECNLTGNSYLCSDGNISKFLNLSAIPQSELKKYKVLEWLGNDVYSKRGLWDNNLKIVKPGFSGFVDLKKTYEFGGDEYNITTPFSDFNIVKSIDSNWTSQWGIDGDIFAKRYEVLIFSGPSFRGDFLDTNTSYGWWKTKFPNNKATRVFEINETRSDFSKNILHIKAIDESNSSTIYEGYFLVNSAYALVPVCNNANCTDYNLTLHFNYFPWNNQDYTDGNSSLIASHVTQFKFREDNGVVRLYICISSPKIIINNEPLTVCKEKVVF